MNKIEFLDIRVCKIHGHENVYKDERRVTAEDATMALVAIQ